MIELKIGTTSRNFNNIGEIDENWITRQIADLRNNTILPCIRVSIEEGSVNLFLATQGCASSGGGSRLPNREESRIFDLWREMKLDGENLQPGILVAFFKRIRNIIG